MKFLLVDKIECLEPGRRIVTTKSLSLAEEYLADHFPTFPVLPGVLMLEAMTQSAAWLVRIQQDFRKSIIVLSSARNVRYNYFLKPGNTLRCEVEVISIAEDTAKFKGSGYVADRLAVSARLELKCMEMADKVRHGKDIDERITAQVKEMFELVGGPAALSACSQAASD
ncbi:MAG TPA: beta-hydroxyacyl-ACP dehydratase [bacterium]|nr:beta-hydroxyacyl-ACP dehydratase [bacterium]